MESSRRTPLTSCRSALHNGFVTSSPQFVLDEKGYVSEASQNLIDGVSLVDFEADLRQGDGNEMEGKFRAAHSSSALAVNTFAPFKSDLAALRLSENRSGRARAYEQSEALLVRLIFDDRGNRMTPVFANKGPVRYRYYQSWVLAQGRKSEAGSISRVPADDVERAVANALLGHLGQLQGFSSEGHRHSLIRTHVEKVTVHPYRLEIALHQSEADAVDRAVEPHQQASLNLTLEWSKPSARRHRAILGSPTSINIARPIRSEARSRLITGIARGRRWLEQLADGHVEDLTSIATQHGLSEKTVRSMISLAFLAPDIIQAAIEGRLPRGLGISQMTDMPVAWDAQRRQLGLI